MKLLRILSIGVMLWCVSESVVNKNNYDKEKERYDYMVENMKGMNKEIERMLGKSVEGMSVQEILSETSSKTSDLGEQNKRIAILEKDLHDINEKIEETQKKIGEIPNDDGSLAYSIEQKVNILEFCANMIKMDGVVNNVRSCGENEYVSINGSVPPKERMKEITIMEKVLLGAYLHTAGKSMDKGFFNGWSTFEFGILEILNLMACVGLNEEAKNLAPLLYLESDSMDDEVKEMARIIFCGCFTIEKGGVDVGTFCERFILGISKLSGIFKAIQREIVSKGLNCNKTISWINAIVVRIIEMVGQVTVPDIKDSQYKEYEKMVGSALAMFSSYAIYSLKMKKDVLEEYMEGEDRIDVVRLASDVVMLRKMSGEGTIDDVNKRWKTIKETVREILNSSKHMKKLLPISDQLTNSQNEYATRIIDTLIAFLEEAPKAILSQ